MMRRRGLSVRMHYIIGWYGFTAVRGNHRRLYVPARWGHACM